MESIKICLTKSCLVFKVLIVHFDLLSLRIKIIWLVWIISFFRNETIENLFITVCFVEL